MRPIAPSRSTVSSSVACLEWTLAAIQATPQPDIDTREKQPARSLDASAGAPMLAPPEVTVSRRQPLPGDRGGPRVISRRRALLFALLFGTILGAPMAVAAGGKSPISVEVLVGFSCVTGTGPARQEVVATLRSPDMRVRDQVVSHSDRDGLWGVCFSLFNPSTYVNGGDHLRIKVGDHARSIDIPRLEPRIDRVNDVIEGRADPGIDGRHRRQPSIRPPSGRRTSSSPPTPTARAATASTPRPSSISSAGTRSTSSRSRAGTSSGQAR